MKIRRNNLSKILWYVALALGITLVLWLLFWYLFIRIPGLIPRQEAEQIARAEAQQMCEKRAEKEDIDCVTLNFSLMNTSKPGITDSEMYYYYFKFVADNKNSSKQWDFDITLLPDGQIERRDSHLSISPIKDK